MQCHAKLCFYFAIKISFYCVHIGSSSWSKSNAQKFCFLLQSVFSCFPQLTKHISIFEAEFLTCITISYLSWKQCFPLFHLVILFIFKSPPSVKKKCFLNISSKLCCQKSSISSLNEQFDCALRANAMLKILLNKRVMNQELPLNKYDNKDNGMIWSNTLMKFSISSNAYVLKCYIWYQKVAWRSNLVIALEKFLHL